MSLGYLGHALALAPLLFCLLIHFEEGCFLRLLGALTIEPANDRD